MAFDIASNTGFAFGETGSRPRSGSIRFAPAGSDHELIFANALKWASEQMRVERPGLVIWEAPIPAAFKSGFTNVNTTKILYGLPAVFGAVAHLLGVNDIREAPVQSIRRHFIGQNPKKAVAKKLIIAHCRSLGLSPADDNEADALAIWHYACATIGDR